MYKEHATEIIKFSIPDTKVYFASWNRGIKAYSTLTSQVKTIVNNRTAPTAVGIAYDSTHNKIYWGSLMRHKIYRANMDGSRVEALWYRRRCKNFYSVIEMLVLLLPLKLSDAFLLVCRRESSRSGV